jgi:hypothetical protein
MEKVYNKRRLMSLDAIELDPTGSSWKGFLMEPGRLDGMSSYSYFSMGKSWEPPQNL